MSGPLPIVAEGLDEARIAAILAARVVPAATAADPVAHVPILRVTIGDEPFGIPLSAVREVGPLRPVTRVPDAPPALVGVFAWRATLYNLLEPAAALGVVAAASAHVVLLRGAAPRFALRVGTVDGIAHAPAPAGEALAEPVEDAAGRFLLIDPARLIDRLLPSRQT